VVINAVTQWISNKTDVKVKNGKFSDMSTNAKASPEHAITSNEITIARFEALALATPNNSGTDRCK
jgi:hypothetical protein